MVPLALQFVIRHIWIIKILFTHLCKLLPFGALSKQTYLYFSVHPSSTSTLQNSTNDRIGNKNDSMVSLLGCKDIDKMSMQFLGMSATPSSCDLMRQHRVVPFLVKILHSGGQMQSKEIKRRYLEIYSSLLITERSLQIIA